MAIKLEKKRERKIKLWNLESWFFGGRKFGEPNKKKNSEANEICTTWNPHIWNDTKEREGNFPNPLTPEI